MSSSSSQPQSQPQPQPLPTGTNEASATKSSGSRSSAVAAVKDVLASIVGSAACVYTGQPFDTIKVRIQVQPGFFPNPLLCMRTTVMEEGVLALWRGSVPAFLGALSENAMAFGVNGGLKRLLNGISTSSVNNSNSSVVNSDSVFSQFRRSLMSPTTLPFITGGITGSMTSIVLCPFDILKCRAQINRLQGSNSSLAFVSTSIYRKSGFRGFFTGFSMQFTRDIMFYSSFFGSYDVLCLYLKKYTSLSDPVVYFTAGGLAGQIAWILSIAMDTVKSRMQTSSEDVVPSARAVAKNIIQTQGYRGFFRGIEVAVIRAFPANAALFVGYELTKEALDAVVPDSLFQ